jgi:hypothetical protein
MTGSILLRNGKLSDVLGELQVGLNFSHFLCSDLITRLVNRFEVSDLFRCLVSCVVVSLAMSSSHG